MTLWNFCTMVGIITLTWLALAGIHFIVECILVMRVGWTRLEELGFWRAIPASFKRSEGL